MIICTIKCSVWPTNDNVSYFLVYIYNLCVNTTESNTIEKIVKKQNVLKNHSLQSDKVGFCVGTVALWHTCHMCEHTHERYDLTYRTL